MTSSGRSKTNHDKDDDTDHIMAVNSTYMKAGFVCVSVAGFLIQTYVGFNSYCATVPECSYFKAKAKCTTLKAFS